MEMTKDTLMRVDTGPTRWYYGLAMLVFTIGVTLSGMFLSRSLLSPATDTLTQVVVPGKQDLLLSTPGEYTIFYEYQSVVGNKRYATGPFQGLDITVRSKATGSEVALSRASTAYTYTAEGRAGVAFWKFTIDQPGLYEFAAQYSEGGRGPELVFAIGSSDGALFGGALMILLGSGVATIWIAAGTFSRRRKAKARTLLPASELAAIQSDWHAPSELLAGPLPRSVRLALTGFGKLSLGAAIFWTSVGSFAAVTAPKRPLSADSLQAVGTILLPWTVLLLLPWLFVLLACRGVRPQVLGLWVFFLGVAFTILFCVATQWSPVAAERMGWLIFGWMAALIGCPIFWRIAFHKNLLEVGRPAAAAVTGMSTVSISRGPPAVRVTYQFLDAAGNVVEGTDISTSEMWKQRCQEWESARHAPISWEDLPQGKMGLLGFLRWRMERRPSRSPRAATVSPTSEPLPTVITVLYDSKDPRRNTFYPADAVKIAGTAEPTAKML